MMWEAHRPRHTHASQRTPFALSHLDGPTSLERSLSLSLTLASLGNFPSLQADVNELSLLSI